MACSFPRFIFGLWGQEREARGRLAEQQASPPELAIEEPEHSEPSELAREQPEPTSQQPEPISQQPEPAGEQLSKGRAT